MLEKMKCKLTINYHETWRIHKSFNDAQINEYNVSNLCIIFFFCRNTREFKRKLFVMCWWCLRARLHDQKNIEQGLKGEGYATFSLWLFLSSYGVKSGFCKAT